ncbi:toxin-antitoxin system YwqK family antitoxin [Algibacter amylolyticus]|uniref:Toxin-antitoxin system YwqK family antitoxin n=1 Tax=Algibacter amylolyticus TaxID=1608400 RepID=A0A5M7B285_9FLAO|nr:toxin-antitoxin system YwqK family antitoxin [Algibacter amylolyticus]KAA5822398.1 toxin-antitoxin system YwqK family antitoxin [Algibacter amylolyticus]MBB5269116.1 antitoxin component YwqK of YwqJK toxin-antitoxin module [Algibacter amylolyticus]TSJ73548.1 toxin-antitoxin system YwqK family antitoxin [Algibacter amylolyticus]
MKIGYNLFFFLMLSGVMFGQTINQFDENGKRHGVWQKKFEGTDVLRYEGQFAHGKEIGLFKFYKYYKKKGILSATKLFNDTNQKAEVTFLASNGRVISKGEMDGKTYIGTWKYYQKNSDQLLIIENYNDNGALIDERLVYYPNGQIAEKQNYVNGKLDGESLWLSEKNVVLKSYVYENGELHGDAKFYNPKGELLSEGRYKRDKKDGVWKYYENGKLTNEKDFTYKPKYIKKTP